MQVLRAALFLRQRSDQYLQQSKTLTPLLPYTPPQAAEALADPQDFANLFPDLDLALKAERLSAAQRSQPQPASSYSQVEGSTLTDLIAAVAHMDLGDLPPAANGHPAAGKRTAIGLERAVRPAHSWPP